MAVYGFIWKRRSHFGHFIVVVGQIDRLWCKEGTAVFRICIWHTVGEYAPLAMFVRQSLVNQPYFSHTILFQIVYEKWLC